MAKVDPRRVFDTGRMFESAAFVIKAGAQTDWILPWSVNASFAIELYLKCLLIMEGSEPGETHGLKELFRNLHRHTKASLTKQFNALSKTSPVKARMRDQGLATDLDAELERSRDAFTLLRYHYEDVHPEQSGFTVGFLINLTRELILKRKPEWQEYIPA